MKTCENEYCVDQDVEVDDDLNYCAMCGHRLVRIDDEDDDDTSDMS